MKKRLFCLFLCVLMALIPVLSGCSSEDDTSVTTTTTTSGVKAMTLTLYAITGENTTEDAIASVQDSINAITEVEFNTHIVLRLFTEDEYYDAIEGNIKAIEDQNALDEAQAAARKVAQKAAKAAGVTTTPVTTSEDTTVETDETLLDEYGLEKTVYPDVTDSQLDIFLITNLDKYLEYYNRGVLLQLDEELSVNSKILNDYIYPSFMSAVKVDGGTYAIPNNHMIGEYEYMLINKSLFDKYYFDIDNITVINDLEDYVNTVADKEPGVTPVIDTYGAESYMYYPTGEQSVFAGYAAGKLAAGTQAAPKDIFGLRQYKTAAALLEQWKMDGDLVSDSSIDGKDFGVAFVKGDYSLAEQYKDNYYVVTYKYPTFDNSNTYESMFAVGAYTKSVSRCMEIITYLTINEEMRNTFQYGTENVNYERDEYTGVVNMLNNDYEMNPIYTGNMFKLWQSSSMSEDELKLSDNDWEMAKLQNFDTSVSPYLGFTIKNEPEEEEASTATDATADATDTTGTDTTETVAYMKVEDVLAGLADLSDEYFAKLEAFKPGNYPVTTTTTDDNGNEDSTEEQVLIEDVGSYIDYLAAEIDANEYMVQALNADNENSLISQYTTWYDTMYPSAAE